MSIEMHVELDKKSIDKLFKITDWDKYDKASASAMKKTSSVLATKMKQGVAGQDGIYNIKSEKVAEAINVYYNSNSAHIKVNTRARGLMGFGAKQFKGGVKVTIKKGKGNRKLIKGAFVARGKNGNEHVFRRFKGTRKLKVLHTLSISQMFTEDIVEGSLLEAKNAYREKFFHELDRRFDKR